jgi:hypothetical protein
MLYMSHIQHLLGAIAVIRIEILSDEVFVRRVEKEGRLYEFHKQEAFVHLGQKYPVRCLVRVEPGKQYSPGIYILDRSSFWVDRYGELRLTPRLVPARPIEKASVA